MAAQIYLFIYYLCFSSVQKGTCTSVIQTYRAIRGRGGWFSLGCVQIIGLPITLAFPVKSSQVKRDVKNHSKRPWRSAASLSRPAVF